MSLARSSMRAAAPSFRAPAMRQARPVRMAARRYATGNAAGTPPPPPPSTTGTAAGGHSGTLIILGALAALGAGGYYFLKPVRDVASMANSAATTVKEGASGIGSGGDLMSAIAQASLPSGAFAIYSQLAKTDGGINGFLSSLKDKDLESVLGEVKKVGGDDVKRIIEKVEGKLKAANGKASQVDWQALATELKGELPKEAQQMVDFFIGKIPNKGDFDKYIADFKKIGEDKMKDVEKSASKIMAQVDKARKDGKSQADALLAGLKDAAPGDLDQLVKQLKDAAKSAGLPADTAESWLKSKAEDGKVNAEEFAKQMESKLRMASKMIPGEPKDLVKQVEQFSPSVAKLLQQAMIQAEITDEKGNRK